MNRWNIALISIACIMSFGGELWAQSGVSVHIHGGGALPTTPFVTNGVRVDGDSLSGNEIASIVDQYNNFGFQAGAGVVIDSFEVRYSLDRFGWDYLATTCVGANEPAVLLSGEVDDSAVEYDCFGEDAQTETSLDEAGLTPLLMHTLSVGPRVHFTPAESPVKGYVIVAPGLGLTTYNDNSADGSVLFGFYLNAGAGALFYVSEQLAITLEGRYHLFLTRPPYRHQMVANRVTVRDQSAFAAVFDVFQFFTFNLGVNFAFH